MGCTKSHDKRPEGAVDASLHCVLKKKSVYRDEDLTVVVNAWNGALYSVNDYTIYQEIGKGATSVAYLAMKDGVLFAVKVQRRKDTSSAETSCLKNLEHPNVVELREVAESEGHHMVYCFYEYLSGGALCNVSSSGYLQEPIWPVHHTRKIFSQVLETLVHLHRVGIVHRDLKPDNILWTDTSKVRVKLIDFGSVLHLKTQNDTSRKTVGTPFFMPPEVSTGDKFPSKELDVWSIGVMMYLVSTGKVPFGAGCTSAMQYYMKLEEEARDNLDFPDGFDPELQEVISKILDADIVNRVTLDELRNLPWFTGYKYPVPLEDVEQPLSPLSPFLFVHRSALPRSPSKKREVHKEDVSEQGFNILVADSHYRSLHIMVQILKTLTNDCPCGITIDSCADADEAVVSSNTLKYDIIFLNIHNPQMSGIEASQCIKTSSKFNMTTAIVGMATSCTPELLEIVQKAGMENLLLKPTNEQDVRDILKWAGLPLDPFPASIDYNDIYDSKNCYDTCWKRKSLDTCHITMPMTSRKSV